MFACDAAGRSSLQEPLNATGLDATLVWSQTRDHGTFSDLSVLGCVTNKQLAVCGPERSPSTKNNVLSGVFVGNGSVAFQLDVGISLGNVTGSPSLSLISRPPTSYFFWNDAKHMLLSNASGADLWHVTFANYVYGDFFPMTITTGSPEAPLEVLVIAMANGFIFSYTTQGIIVAGVYLNAENSAGPATHVPVAPLVTSGYRVFVSTRSLKDPTQGRLFAYDIRDVAVDRMKLVYYVDFSKEADPAPELRDEKKLPNVLSFEPFMLLPAAMTSSVKTGDLTPSQPSVLVMSGGDDGSIVLLSSVTEATSAADVSLVRIWLPKSAPAAHILLVATTAEKSGFWACIASSGTFFHVKVSGKIDAKFSLSPSTTVTSRLLGFSTSHVDEGILCGVVDGRDKAALMALDLGNGGATLWKVPMLAPLTGQLASDGSDSIIARSREGIVAVKVE